MGDPAASRIRIEPMTVDDGPAVLEIYDQGIATGNATLETATPDWAHWQTSHRRDCRLVARDGDGGVVGWTALGRYSTREVLEIRFPPGEGAPDLTDLAERVEVLPDRILLYTATGEAALEQVHARGIRPLSSLVRRSTLEDVFLRLTGRALTE